MKHYFRPCGYYDELSATDYFVEVVAPRCSRGGPAARYVDCVIRSAGVLGPEGVGAQ